MRRSLWAVAAAVALTFSGCARRTTQVSEGIRDQVLHMGNGVEPGDLDPATNTGAPESIILGALFEPLVVRNANADGVDPAAAGRFEISEDGRSYTFHLRENLRWSNGDPVTAQDYRQSFLRALNPKLASQPAIYMYPVEGAEEYHKGATHDPEKIGFAAPDAHTLVMRLRAPMPHFLQTLVNYPWMAVHFPTLQKFGGIDRPGAAWTRPGHLVSNGAYRLKEWRPNQMLVVERNPYYWNAAHVRLNEIRFYPIENLETEERTYRAGQLHVTSNLAVSKIDFYREHNPAALRVSPRLGVSYVLFNTTVAPFTDARVRQAFAFALNRAQLVDRVLRGGQTPAFSFSQPGMGGFQPQHVITAGPDDARRLLADAGFPGGRGFPKVEYLYNTSDLNREIAQALQEMWRRELGVEVALVNQEWKVFLDTRQLGHFQLARSGWYPFAAEPIDYFQLLLSYSHFNDSKWANTEFDALFSQAATTLDQASRHRLYHQMDAILLREMPVAPLYHASIVRLVHPAVQGWRLNLLDSHPLDEVWLDGEF